MSRIFNFLIGLVLGVGLFYIALNSGSKVFNKIIRIARNSLELFVSILDIQSDIFFALRKTFTALSKGIKIAIQKKN